MLVMPAILFDYLDFKGGLGYWRLQLKSKYINKDRTMVSRDDGRKLVGKMKQNIPKNVLNNSPQIKGKK